MKIETAKQIALKIIEDFPKSKSREPYLTMKNGRKLFFNRFIRKYGLKTNTSNYNERDLLRRVARIEFFDYFIKNFDLKPAKTRNKLILESYFHRMIILKRKVGAAQKYELLSFYPK